MPVAYVLVTLEVGVEPSEIMNALSKLNEVVEMHEVFHGDFDLIAKVETESLEGLERLIFGRVRRIPGVRSTMTMVVIG